ncbi:MAG: hypothetical protein GY906_23620 [bacterium]|nr:hypothetical protein [bacterium]
MSKPARPSPALAASDASAKIAAASAAVGLSPQQLGDLIFESGDVSLPTSDGITERYTLEDLGKRLWGTLQTTPRHKRAEWFGALTDTQKTAVIVVLRDRGFRTEVIARDLKIPAADVTRTWNAYSGDLGTQVIGIRLDTIAGQLQMAAERAQQLAIAADDHAAYWRIQKEFTSLLQSIGIVDKAIHRVEVTHKMDDAQKHELEEFVLLESKKAKRLLEIEQLEAVEEEGEALPEEVKEADYDAEE